MFVYFVLRNIVKYRKVYIELSIFNLFVFFEIFFKVYERGFFLKFLI